MLLHANTGNADGWQYNISGFVEAGYRAIAFDRAEFIVLPEASHSMNREQPEAFNRNVLQFIRRF